MDDVPAVKAGMSHDSAAGPATAVTAATVTTASHDKGHLYGTTNIVGRDPMHGTHVAGIIGGIRTKDFAVKGIADDVSIMTVRAVPPDGDETDDDVANSIRYAVDNGAKVVNMSFGKTSTTNKKAVDDAVKYAMSKDVLLVHAAGNDSKNLDVDPRTAYPNRTYADGSGTAAAWIEVGASTMRNRESLVAPFSNYGKTTVDVFAPGTNIVSSVPGGGYRALSGTSMAAPVVTGLAALIRSRYPKLTAVQVKEIIMRSVAKVDHDVRVRENGAVQTVPFSDVCISGGVVNAYNALKLAATYK
jgi:subtilisin family serine protease